MIEKCLLKNQSKNICSIRHVKIHVHMARLRSYKKIFHFRVTSLVFDFVLYLSVLSIKTTYSKQPYKCTLVHIPITPITIPKTSL